MEEKLVSIIEQKTPQKDISKAKELFASMLDGDVLSLSEKELYKALSLRGSYILLELDFQELLQEIESKRLQYLISEALCIVTSFEDDHNRFSQIKDFLEYINKTATQEQSLLFSVKTVKELSKKPIKVAFCGILPINQLRLYLGEDIYNYIHQHNDELQERFAKLREDISLEIGIKILPLFPILDRSLPPKKAKLVDRVTKEVVAEFDIKAIKDIQEIDIYLLKLFYIYKTLAQKICV